MKRTVLVALAVIGVVIGVLCMRTPSAPSCSNCASSLTIGSDHLRAHGRTRGLGLLSFLVGGSFGIAATGVHRPKRIA